MALLYLAWNYSALLGVDTTSAGADITTDQENFPILLRLDETNFPFSQALPDGDDIRFTNEDGDVNYSFEIDRWNSILEEAEIWIRVPTVSANTVTPLKMYWGKSDAISNSFGVSTFPTSESYTHVLHLNEELSTWRDSTWNGYDLTAFSDLTASLPHAVSGNIYQGQYFDGDPDGSPKARSEREYAEGEITNTSAVTFSFWINVHEFKNTKRIGGTEQWPYTGNPWVAFMDEDPKSLWFGVLDGPYADGEGTQKTALFSGSDDVIEDEWYFFGGRYEQSLSAVTVRVNRMPGNTSGTTSGGPLLTSGYFNISENRWNTLPATIDELRIENVPRSDDWLDLRYEIERIGSTVVSITEIPETLKLIIRNSTFDNTESKVTSGFVVVENTLSQYSWTKPTNWPFTYGAGSNYGYGQNLAWLSARPQMISPFEGIEAPPNPGYNFSAYPGYETGLFGYDRATYDNTD